MGMTMTEIDTPYSQAYLDGWEDGKADRPPRMDKLALGCSYCNDYERGYIDSGRLTQLPGQAEPCAL